MLLAGVSSVVKPPGAPPGKEIETPPVEGQNEFEDVLKQAEGKSSGEVAEAEPNAQPQKLDSTEDTTQIGALPIQNWVELLGLAVINSPLVVPTDAMAAIEPGTAVPAPADQSVSLVPLQELVSPQVEQGLNIVSVSAKTVSVGTKTAQVQEVVVAQPEPVEAHQKPLLAAPVKQSVEVAQTIAEPVVAEASSTTVSGSTEIKTKVESEDSVIPAGDVSFLAESAESFGESDQSDTNPGGQGQHAQPESKVVSSVTTQKVEQSVGMTSAERKAVVHQLTQKIEALAVNSVRNEIVVKMEPAELGSVLVQVSRGVGEMTASLSASNEKLHDTLHEARNELAAALTAKTSSTVRVEVISSDSTPMGTAGDQNRQSSPQQQPRQEAVTRFFQPREGKATATDPSRERVSTGLIDLES